MSTTDLEELLRLVERLWWTEDEPGCGPEDGFLWHYRNGRFDPKRSAMALSVLRGIDTKHFPDSVPKELVRLLWWIPRILEWNMERVKEQGADMESVTLAVSEIEEELNRILGVP